MKIYRLHMQGDFAAYDSAAIWFTRRADIEKITRELRGMCMDDLDIQMDPYLDEFEVPSRKDELVAFFNRYCFR